MADLQKNELQFIGVPATFAAGYGDFLKIQTVQATITLSGATTAATSLIPAGSLVLGVTGGLTTTATGATSIKIGDGTTANLFANALSVTAPASSTFADHLSTFAPKIYAAATNVVATAVGGAVSFSAGQLRLVVYYMMLTGPTV